MNATKKLVPKLSLFAALLFFLLIILYTQGFLDDYLNGNGSGAETFIVGNNIVYSETGGDANYIRGNQFIPQESGVVKLLHIYLRSDSVNSRKCTLALYSGDGINVGTKLYEASPINLVPNDPPAWREVEVAETVEVTAGQSYWLLFITSCPNVKFYWGSGGSTDCLSGHLVRYNVGSYEFPTTFTADSYDVHCLSMYMTCETVENES